MTGLLSSLRQRAWGSLTDGARLLTALDRGRNRHSHLVVETPSGSAGFALFGGWQSRHLFARVYLGDTESSLIRVALHRTATSALCERLVDRYGLVVFCGESVPPALRSQVLTMPAWIEMERPTPRLFHEPGEDWSSSAKRDIRKIRQQRFEYEVLTGDDWLREFYDRMFLPTMKKRHRAEAHVTSRTQLMAMSRAEGAEFLRVLQDGIWVAGSLSQSTPAGYRFLRLGWLGGEADLLHKGVVGAMYWFGLRRAAALGHAHVLFGGGHPFLEDGVLAYKSKWGAAFSADIRAAGEFHLLLEPSHPVCRRFLEDHSLIAIGRDRQVIVLSAHDPGVPDVGPETMRSIQRWYRWREDARCSSEIIPSGLPGRLHPWLDTCPLPEP